MKIKALMKRKIRGTKISSMTNDRYKKVCKTELKDKITSIKKVYSDSMSDAGKYFVR